MGLTGEGVSMGTVEEGQKTKGPSWGRVSQFELVLAQQLIKLLSATSRAFILKRAWVGYLVPLGRAAQAFPYLPGCLFLSHSVFKEPTLMYRVHTGRFVTCTGQCTQTLLS